MSATDEENHRFSMYPKQYDRKYTDGSFLLVPGHGDDNSPQGKVGQPGAQDRDSQPFKTCVPSQNIMQSTPVVKGPSVGHGDVAECVKNSRFGDGGHLVTSMPSHEFGLDVEDLNIPWNDLVIKERIGAGISFLSLLLTKKSCGEPICL